jgi:hypothetical protein
MRLSRLVFGFLPAVFLLAACDDDGLGIGIGDDDQYTATLSGANVRPTPVSTGAAATVTFSIREPAIGSSVRSIGYSINVTGLTSATSAHIHLGGAAVSDGPLLVSLFTNPGDTAITAGSLATGSFTESNIGGGVSFDSLVTLMQTGNAYVDIHARTNTAGIVRGQITRSGETPRLDVFAVPSLTGAKERPTPVVTTATGSATLELLPGGSVRYTVTVAGLTGATMAHIHHAVADSAGPIVVPLFNSTTPTGPLTGTLASGTFTASNIQLPGVSMDSLLALMRRGRTYVNVHTEDNPAGEIRGQIEPVSVLP